MGGTPLDKIAKCRKHQKLCNNAKNIRTFALVIVPCKYLVNAMIRNIILLFLNDFRGKPKLTKMICFFFQLKDSLINLSEIRAGFVK